MSYTKDTNERVKLIKEYLYQQTKKERQLEKTEWAEKRQYQFIDALRDSEEEDIGSLYNDIKFSKNVDIDFKSAQDLRLADAVNFEAEMCLNHL